MNISNRLVELARKLAFGVERPIDEFNEYFSTHFSDEEFDTIGGLVIQALGHMPARNEMATIDKFEFQVINADQRKIHSLRMRPLHD